MPEGVRRSSGLPTQRGRCGLEVILSLIHGVQSVISRAAAVSPAARRHFVKLATPEKASTAS